MAVIFLEKNIRLKPSALFSGALGFQISLRLRAARAALAATVTQHDQQTGHAVQEHQRVGHDEDPVMNEPAINCKAGGSRHLTDEKPQRDALARSLVPLLVNLL